MTEKAFKSLEFKEKIFGHTDRCGQAEGASHQTGTYADHTAGQQEQK